MGTDTGGGDAATDAHSPDADEQARTVRVIGAATDYGANRGGVDMGPSAIRYAGLGAQPERAGELASSALGRRIL